MSSSETRPTSVVPILRSARTRASTTARKNAAPATPGTFPVVFGPLAVTYNVKGVDDLVLDGPTSAKIFNGAITTWDDPAIKALNEGASLPSEKINVIYRNGRVGHHRQLPEVPRRSLGRRLGQRRGQVVRRWRR